MRKIYFFVAFFIPTTFLFGQTTTPTQTSTPPASGTDNGTATMNNLQGLLRMQLTIAPSWDVKGSSGNTDGSIAGDRTNIYLHGTLEYYWTERFSMRGDAFYLMNKEKDKPGGGGVQANHTIEVGASYHLRKGMGWDPYIGLTGGISYVKIYPMDFTRHDGLVLEDYAIAGHLEPVWAPRIGMNFFGAKVFHFFIEAQYLMGTYRPPVGPILSLNEVRISAGLGYNFVILHKAATIQQKI